MFVQYFTIVSQDVMYKSIAPLCYEIIIGAIFFIAPMTKSYRKCDMRFSQVSATMGVAIAMMAWIEIILCISSRSGFHRSGRSLQQCMCL